MKSSRLKNFTLVKSHFGNAESRKLIGDDGSYWPFDMYMTHLLSKGVARSTRINYANDIAYFIDFLTEASNAVTEGALKPDPLFLNNVFMLWPQFMLLTEEQRLESKGELLRVLGSRLAHGKVGDSTVARRIASLNGFFELSDRFHQVLKDREKYSSGDGVAISDDKLLPQISGRRDITAKEKHQLIANSMLAGVVSRGPKLMRTKAFKRKTASYKSKAKTSLQTNPTDKAFPPNRIEDLINAAFSYRDKAYLSLLAASGIRGHEAWQILWEDIDPINRTVKVVAPWERRFTEKWAELSVQQQEDIAWKGRETEMTFLLEPYASMFWEYLSAYRKMRKEWSDAIPHPFVFVTARRYGYKPLITVSVDSINDIFKKPMKALSGLPHRNYAGHSLRHSYGITLAWGLNLGDGRTGLPINYVRDLMGHASLSSTDIYTKPTTEQVLKDFDKGNQLRMVGRVDVVELAKQIENSRVEVPAEEVKRIKKGDNDDG